MGITYNKKEKCGEATFRRELDGMEYIYTVDLYVGNCSLIMVFINEKRVTTSLVFR